MDNDIHSIAAAEELIIHFMNGPTWFEYEHWLDGGGTFLPSSDPPQVLRTMNTDDIREPGRQKKTRGEGTIIGSGISVIKSQQQQQPCIMSRGGRGL